MKNIRPTILEVNLSNLEYNIQKIKEYVGKNVNIMPVIKANAYGTYINKINEILNKFDIVSVAIVSEAIELRKQGFNKKIFVLNQPATSEINEIIKYDISIGVSDKFFIEKLGQTNAKIKVHLEIDTGMGRTGINPCDTEKYIDILKKYPNLIIEGIYTHLSSADTDFNYTENQIELFDSCVLKFIKEFDTIKYIHASASNGILNFKNSYYNLVRPGIILYGYKSNKNTYEKINLKPVCKLKSKVTFLKQVEENTSIGYSRSFITKKKSIIATIPIGYADGLKRILSNRGFVVINNKKVPIIGTICMDSIMVDVTNIENVNINTDVYIWDNKIITLEDIAEKANTINYEILSTISDRVPRIFVEGGEYINF